jgi:hypothetical protein
MRGTLASTDSIVPTPQQTFGEEGMTETAALRSDRLPKATSTTIENSVSVEEQ